MDITKKDIIQKDLDQLKGALQKMQNELNKTSDEDLERCKEEKVARLMEVAETVKQYSNQVYALIAERRIFVDDQHSQEDLEKILENIGTSDTQQKHLKQPGGQANKNRKISAIANLEQLNRKKDNFQFETNQFSNKAQKNEVESKVGSFMNTNEILTEFNFVDTKELHKKIEFLHEKNQLLKLRLADSDKMIKSYESDLNKYEVCNQKLQEHFLLFENEMNKARLAQRQENLQTSERVSLAPYERLNYLLFDLFRIQSRHLTILGRTENGIINPYGGNNRLVGMRRESEDFRSATTIEQEGSQLTLQEVTRMARLYKSKLISTEERLSETAKELTTAKRKLLNDLRTIEHLQSDKCVFDAIHTTELVRNKKIETILEKTKSLLEKLKTKFNNNSQVKKDKKLIVDQIKEILNALNDDSADFIRVLGQIELQGEKLDHLFKTQIFESLKCVAEVNQVLGGKKEIGGYLTFLAMKNPTSYLIATKGKGLILV